MGAITPLHLVIVLVVALFVIGPRKLPETGAALGKAIRQFRDAASGLPEDPAAPEAPAAPAAQATASAPATTSDTTPNS